MQTLDKATQRQEKIHDLVLSKHTITLKELISILNCSEATIRNDLTKLEKKGVLKRVLGGAVSTEKAVRNTILSKRLHQELKEKYQIAEYALHHLIKPNMILTLDSGTTNMALAHSLVFANIPCTIITNSFEVANIVSKSDQIQLYLAGGFFDNQHGSFHDDISEATIKSYRSDICFISPNGLDLNGNITNSGVAENTIKQYMMQQADKTIILADHTKLCKTELRIICHVKDVDLVITDTKADTKKIKALKKAGFPIIQSILT